jgi:threonylcarbamoyladenosine tRNA methylthiotransferase MtaB
VKYSVLTFGCRVNQADSFDVEGELLARGATASAPEDADVVVINTCSVTSSADQAARQTVRRITRQNPNARIFVTGCYATRRPDDLRGSPAVVVLPNDRKPTLGADIATQFGLPEVTTADRYGEGDSSCGAALAPGVAGRTAITLRVQAGCDEPCAYCIIPSTRGAPRSVALHDVLRQVRQMIASGFKEVVVTGVHLGSYGRDLTPRLAFIDLLRALTPLTAAVSAPSFRPSGRAERARQARVRFRISSLEPMDCSPAVVDLLTGSEAVAQHFHLPLQHASDRVLASMGRPYTLDRYRDVVDRLRARSPAAAIGSDVIVGFPGERDDDFEMLARYLAASPLTHVHVFPYSDRPGTVASRLPDKVPGSVVRERARRIREISASLSERFHGDQVGCVYRALTIDDGATAVTGNYLKVRIPPGCARNEWVSVRIDGGAGRGLTGTVTAGATSVGETASTTG